MISQKAKFAQEDFQRTRFQRFLENLGNSQDSKADLILPVKP